MFLVLTAWTLTSLSLDTRLFELSESKLLKALSDLLMEFMKLTKAIKQLVQLNKELYWIYSLRVLIILVLVINSTS